MKTLFKPRVSLCIIAFFISVHTYSQIPIYNSYPTATATVYLDFDGQYLEGTSWNYSGPLSLGPANMSTDQVTEIFNRVSEDYRPFNINITTDSAKYWSAPVSQRIRVIFTVTSDWYGAAGGVSYINSFTWADNTPCFVFTALLNYRPKYIAEAASHEIGHTLGLNHQSAYDSYCTKIDEYNPGKGSGEIAWAPIMGVGYYRNFTLWHNGSNPWGCSSYQDDLSIITSNANGFGYRADDYSSNVSGGATQVNFVKNHFSINGVIEKITDKDVFKFTMPVSGIFHLDANPYNVGTGDNGSNLDVTIQLSTSSKNILGTYNPDLLLSTTIDTALEAGTYFLSVQSSGNVYAPDYASLGSYSLAASYQPFTVLPLHRLELKGTDENGRHELSWQIEADGTIVQQSLEMSSDGQNFQNLAALSSNSGIFAYQCHNIGVVYYRVNIVFDKGRHYFSNVVALPGTTGKPFIINRLVRHSVQVNSPSMIGYQVVDYSGKPLIRGKLVPGFTAISTSSLPSGIYLLLFIKGEDVYTEKFIKE